jgi:uncharacterized protein (DUF1919 family)
MASQKTDQEKERDWRKKVRKLSELMFRGNDQERETARQRLDELPTKNRMTWGDVSRLIALSHSNPDHEK